MVNFRYVFLIENNRGLYTSDGTKVYFPDKMNKFELTRGLAKVVVSKDFGNYGFICGEMLQNVGTLEDAVKAGKVDLSSVDYLAQLNGQEYWVCNSAEDTLPTWHAYVDGEVITFEFNRDSDKDIHNYESFVREVMWKSTNDVNLHVFKQRYVDLIIKDLPEITDMNKLYEIIIRSLSSFPKSIKIYGGKVVICDYGSLVGNYKYYIKEGSLVVVYSGIDTSGMSVKDVTEDIKKIILDYNLVINNYDRDIVTHKFYCFDKCIDVDFLSTHDFTFEKYELVKDKLMRSRQKFEEFKKCVGKMINKNNLDELQKLNISKYQLREWKY